MARQGKARRGRARHDKAWLGQARQGLFQLYVGGTAPPYG